MEVSRFFLIEAHHDGQRRYRAGTKIADSAANAQAGDLVSAQLCAKPSAGMAPLDAAAFAAMAAMRIVTSVGAATTVPTGAASADV
jgi:hypothetical protein